MINLCFSLQSHTFIARLKHTNSGKKASCARQNAAFTPRKSIHYTISRYDIGFRTTLQKKTTRKEQKITCSETLETGANQKKPAAFLWEIRFSTRLPARERSKTRANREKSAAHPFGCPFFHSSPGSEMLGVGANPKNRSLPFPDVVFPTQIPDYRVNNNYVNITEYVKLRYFL